MTSTKNEETITDLVAAGMARSEIMLSAMTEEEWEVHEQRVALERKAEHHKAMMQLWSEKKGQLLARGLTERHLEFAFLGKCGDKPAMRAVAKLAESDDSGATIAVLSGNVGCGKTQAAHWWLLGIGSKPIDWKPARVRRATAAWFARTSRYTQDKFDLLAKPERLLLDDLGVEFADSAGSFLVDLDELVDLRWASRKKTIICTNLHSKQFCDRYGKRLYDRARGSDSWFDVRYASMRGSDA